MVMSPLQDVTTITTDSVYVGIVNFFATRIVLYSYALILDALCESMLNILDSSLFAKFGIGVEYIGRILMSIGKIPFMQRSLYVGPR